MDMRVVAMGQARATSARGGGLASGWRLADESYGYRVNDNV